MVYDKSTATSILFDVVAFIKECEKRNLTNEQWFIDFEDRLNKLSVKDHTNSNK